MDPENVDDFLAHYGVKGMKWGQRKVRTAGVPAKVDREARKDASEYAQAKMFYGEGAGNRRKLINATVNAKSKDPAYRKAFDNQLQNQDMAARAAQARGQRRKADAKNATAKTVRGAKNALTGNARYASVGGLALAGALSVGQKTGVNQRIAKSAARKVKDIASDPNTQRRMREASKWISEVGTQIKRSVGR